ncbi:Plasmodium exported protein, unknown function [Plasmodium malariae]|uniref:Uncharacterized protein n=1 Tax=Plasmodium malariae TaxID=5858 RepID=A0A1D3JLD9_PLAMA|nr:Plasmodium exported protein, unknown function [Plasmodium malariae]SBT87282.1 Plasmodium exported protein, unknown function [Plasmodium malariae]
MAQTIKFLSFNKIFSFVLLIWIWKYSFEETTSGILSYKKINLNTLDVRIRRLLSEETNLNGQQRQTYLRERRRNTIGEGEYPFKYGLNTSLENYSKKKQCKKNVNDEVQNSSNSLYSRYSFQKSQGSINYIDHNSTDSVSFEEVLRRKYYIPEKKSRKSSIKQYLKEVDKKLDRYTINILRYKLGFDYRGLELMPFLHMFRRK